MLLYSLSAQTLPLTKNYHYQNVSSAKVENPALFLAEFLVAFLFILLVWLHLPLLLHTSLVSLGAVGVIYLWNYLINRLKTKDWDERSMASPTLMCYTHYQGIMLRCRCWDPLPEILIHAVGGRLTGGADATGLGSQSVLLTGQPWEGEVPQWGCQWQHKALLGHSSHEMVLTKDFN